MSKEAKARIKINKLLEEAGWRFFDSKEGKATQLSETLKIGTDYIILDITIQIYLLYESVPKKQK